MTDLAKDLWDLGAAMNRAHAEIFEHYGERVIPDVDRVYLLWCGDTVLGVCGSLEKAETIQQEAQQHFTEPLRIEARRVHR